MGIMPGMDRFPGFVAAAGNPSIVAEPNRNRKPGDRTLHEDSNHRSARRGLAGALLALLVAGCQPTPQPEGAPTLATTQTTSYSRDIRPLLDTKCVACHACYDAPCQLKLSSGPGLLRGATKNAVYDSSRLRDVPPTRLFVDAEGTAAWRRKGFYSVLNDRGGPLTNNLEYSLLFAMVRLGKTHPLVPNSPVPEDIVFGLDRETSCPMQGEFERYAKDKPMQGMPLAITGLSDGEYETLRQWILEGSVIDEEPLVPAEGEQAQIRRWEEFFNRPAPKNRLVSRYLYEHLFTAHLYFEGPGRRNFFELVRSTTPPGQPVRDVATARPNDDPGQPFFYRFRTLQSTIVHKSHLAYSLSADRMARFEALFLEPDWDVAALPAYSPENAANPFVTFAAMPARGRYEFMLDTAEHFVMTYIRGPVCAGQVATDVIDDRFYVLFQDPDADLSVTDPAYLARVAPALTLVPQTERLLLMKSNWDDRNKERNEYIRLRGQAYREHQPDGPSLDDLWDGGGTNDNAALTVFRNFDNAMVTKGLVGAVPKTLWVMDYPMLERSYYLLVVNFDVFGSVASQVETRLYFDLIRTGGENNFLHFMPAGARTAMRDSWYQGSKLQLEVAKSYVVANEDLPVQIRYRTPDPKAEFVSLVSERLKSLAGPPDVLNRCAHPPCSRPGASPLERRVDEQLQTLTSRPASQEAMEFVDFMPDVAFLRIATANAGEDLAYTLIRNKAHTNVAFMFDEEKRREPGKDTLTIYRGLIGSYPNFMFEVPVARVEAFTRDLHAATTKDEFTRVVARFGLARSHPEIWTSFQWFVDHARRVDPIRAGIYDLSRYKKVADLMSDEDR